MAADTESRRVDEKIAIAIPEMVKNIDLARLEGSFKFDLIHEGKSLSGEFFVVKEMESDSQSPAKLICKLEDAEGKEIAFFTQYFRNDTASVNNYGIAADNKKHRYWLSVYRKMEKDFRGHGLGAKIMTAIEEFIRQLALKYPELTPEWLQVNTGLSSVVRLIIEQEWLKEHGLEEFGTDRRNLGYVPFKADETEAILLLKKKVENIWGPAYGSGSVVRFVKKFNV